MTAAILALLTVWQAPSGPVYGKACRAQHGGCEAHIRWAVQVIDHYSTLNRLPTSLTLAVAYHETRLSAHAVSRIGAWGIMQLHPKSRWGRQVARSCRNLQVDRAHRLCQELVIAEGAALLARSIKRCGSVRTGLGMYSAGKCVVNRYAPEVLRRKKIIEGLTVD